MWRWLIVGDGGSAAVGHRVPVISGDQKGEEREGKDQ
jgi:hypothetical protein